MIVVPTNECGLKQDGLLECEPIDLVSSLVLCGLGHCIALTSNPCRDFRREYSCFVSNIV